MKYYVVDAFTNERFKGNPAGVCVLDKAISSEMMQNIAMENNLSETAFVWKTGETYQLKWFTPGFEIDLCGHATLATSYVIFHFVEPERKQVNFETLSGTLTVLRKENRYEMSFPIRVPKKIEATPEIEEAIGRKVLEVYSERDLYVLLDSVQAVRDFEPDYGKLQSLKAWLGVVIMAKGEDCDFVSRYFCSELNLEDPVTGSTHSSLVPLWSEKCGKKELLSRQLSKRGGVLYCELDEDKVKISGEAVLYLQGEI